MIPVAKSIAIAIPEFQLQTACNARYQCTQLHRTSSTPGMSSNQPPGGGKRASVIHWPGSIESVESRIEVAGRIPCLWVLSVASVGGRHFLGWWSTPCKWERTESIAKSIRDLWATHSWDCHC